MTTWQRRLRFGVAVFIGALAVVLVLSLRRGRAPAPAPILVPHAGPNVVAESTSGRSVRVLGGKPDISVDHYDRLVQYADGRTALTGVTFKVLQRRGRDFTIRAASAVVVGQSPNEDVRLTGDVEIASSDGLLVRTEEASYDHAHGVVSAPGAVTFSKAGLSGSAVGLRYERSPDVLSLLDRVLIHRAAGPDGEGAIDIEAGAASLARGEKAMRFGRGVQVTRPGQTMSAEALTAELSEDEQRVRRLELRGASRVAGSPKAAGGVRTLQARDIDLDYADDGRTLQHAMLTGDAAVELAGSAEGAVQRLAAQSVDIGLGPGGAVLTSLLAHSRVVLDLAADRSSPARTIRAGVLQAAGPVGSGLTAATFADGVEFRESPRAPGAPRAATSSTLALTLGDGFGRIDSASFRGGVVFTEGGLTARSREAQYDVTAGTLRLSGRDDRSGRAPQVSDERATIEGDTIDIVLDGRKITANGSVKTEMRGAEGAGSQDGARARVPAMLQADRSVRAAAARLVYDGDAALATYSGGVDLWQDQVAIQAETIVLDERKGGLSAVGHVVARMQFEPTGAAATGREAPPMVVTAARMAYDDDARRVAYTGGAHLSGGEGDLSAEQVAVFLKAGARQMERLEADGKVTLRLSEGRRADGARLVYQAGAEQYDVTGAPARLRDAFGDTTGRSLTFYRSAATIVVDGREQKRTELRREIKR
jgi:lipopolysaccharide export system protein LptA